MSTIKGRRDYDNFKKGKALSRKQAIFAQCYECNGLEESAIDCITYSCPLYSYSPYGKRKYKNGVNTSPKRPTPTWLLGRNKSIKNEGIKQE